MRIHALAWGGKSVWYRGDAAIEEKNVFHSYYAAYSSQSTGLPPRAPKSFSLLQKPSPPECTTAGEYTRFAPPEWQPLFRYSPLDLQFRPSIHEIPAFPRNPALFLAIRLAIHRLAPFPRPFVYSSWSTSSRLPLPPFSTRVRGFLKTYCRQQSNRASFLLPFRPLPILHRPSHPLYRSFLYTRTAPPMESNVSPVFASTTWPRSIFLHPPRLPIFHRFLALLLPSGRVYSAK